MIPGTNRSPHGRPTRLLGTPHRSQRQCTARTRGPRSDELPNRALCLKFQSLLANPSSTGALPASPSIAHAPQLATYFHFPRFASAEPEGEEIQLVVDARLAQDLYTSRAYTSASQQQATTPEPPSYPPPASDYALLDQQIGTRRPQKHAAIDAASKARARLARSCGTWFPIVSSPRTKGGCDLRTTVERGSTP